MANTTRISTSEKGAFDRPLRIVAIGGGTGLSTLLAALKSYAPGAKSRPMTRRPTAEITAIVTVTDDGGSSGRLRRDFDILPPGDIRNCMTALSEDTDLLSQLFQYRFASGRGLKGHSFGNLFLTAMHQITGDFAHAVKLSSEILAIRGRIYPSTAENVVLEATLADGRQIKGESKISRSRQAIATIKLLPGGCQPLPEALAAIARADLITLGPGSLYTSVIPNLLVNGVGAAIKKSTALKAYFVNLMWQPGETINLTASQHLKAIEEHAGTHLVDCVVLNTADIPVGLRRRYARAHVKPVVNDLEALKAAGVKVVTADLVGSQEPLKTVRHDAGAIAKVVIDLASRSRTYQLRRDVLSARERPPAAPSGRLKHSQ